MRIETWRTSVGERWTIAIAETRAERRRGLLGLDRLGARSGLALLRCRSVHTFGMAFPLDVVVLDRHLTVRRVVRVPARRVVAPRFHGGHILELSARSGVRIGDRFVRDPQPTSTASPERCSTTVLGVSAGIEARTSSTARRR